MSTRTSSSLCYRVLLMAVVIVGLTRPAAAQKCWSATGATAVINTAGLGVATQSAVHLAVRSTAPIPTWFEARYTVSGIQDAPSNSLNGKVFFMRFLDNGSYAQVKAALREIHIDTQVGGTNVVELDSNASLPSDGVQFAVGYTPCTAGGGFDSYNYNYFIKVDIFKTGSGGNPALQLVQVCERAGLPAPFGC